MLHHHPLFLPSKWNRDHLKTFYGSRNGKCLQWNFKVSFKADNLIPFFSFAGLTGKWCQISHEICQFFLKKFCISSGNCFRKASLNGGWILLWLIQLHLLKNSLACNRRINVERTKIIIRSVGDEAINCRLKTTVVGSI